MEHVHHQPTQTNLQMILQQKYLELFGEEYLHEDTQILNNPQPSIITHHINKLTISKLPRNIQYEKAIAEYQRDKEAEITKYKFKSTFTFPPTMRCIKITDTTPEIKQIQPTINNNIPVPISNRKKKKEEWRNKRNQARKTK